MRNKLSGAMCGGVCLKVWRSAERLCGCSERWCAFRGWATRTCKLLQAQHNQSQQSAVIPQRSESVQVKSDMTILRFYADWPSRTMTPLSCKTPSLWNWECQMLPDRYWSGPTVGRKEETDGQDLQLFTPAQRGQQWEPVGLPGDTKKARY